MSDTDMTIEGETETDDFEAILEQVQEEYRDDSSELEDEDEDSYEEEDDSEGEGEVEEEEDSYDDDEEDEVDDNEIPEEPDYQTEAEEEAPQEEDPQEELQEEIPEQEEVVSEIEQMRNMLYQQQQLINQLQLDAPKKEAPQAQPVDPQFAKEAEQLETAFRLQLFGTAADKEDYEELPKSVKSKAQDALKIHAQEESLNILYPERAYQNKIKFFVQRDIKEALGEIMKERQTNKASELFSKYEDVISTPEQKQRLLQEIRSIPGHKSKDWGVQSRVLDTAVDRVLREQKLYGLVERERDLELREAQLRRTQETRQTSTRGKRGRRRPRKKQQTLKSGDDLLEFARSLEQDIRNAR